MCIRKKTPAVKSLSQSSKGIFKLDVFAAFLDNPSKLLFKKNLVKEQQMLVKEVTVIKRPRGRPKKIQMKGLESHLQHTSKEIGLGMA
ncbi:hypothetical protein BC833DRAFT_603523 [Globomyces pollinis-pini]|nr:hypothetical protein BC833DRAFT_603523 [Globomyces pollinis-pini]